MILNIAQRSEKNNNSKKGCEQVCMGGWEGGGVGGVGPSEN